MSEKYRKHCMILENCCYDWFEMNTLNMAQQGVFGEVIRTGVPYSQPKAHFGIIIGRTVRMTSWVGAWTTT